MKIHYTIAFIIRKSLFWLDYVDGFVRDRIGVNLEEGSFLTKTIALGVYCYKIIHYTVIFVILILFRSWTSLKRLMLMSTVSLCVKLMTAIIQGFSLYFFWVSVLLLELCFFERCYNDSLSFVYKLLISCTIG